MAMTNALYFDERQLCEELKKLPPNLRIAFAASCAERLFPSYVDYCSRYGGGDIGFLRDALDRAWYAAQGERGEGDISATIGKCEALVPNTEEAWTANSDYAEDAVSAVIYTLETSSKDSVQEAAWAARCAYDALDSYVTHCLALDFTQPGSEDAALTHPLVQAEFRRQRRDLQDLFAAGSDPCPTVELIRSRAMEDARWFFRVADG